MTDLYLVTVTTSDGTSHHSVPGEHLPLTLEQLAQAAALLGEAQPTVNVQPLHAAHPTTALPGMHAIIQHAERAGPLDSTSRGYLQAGQVLTPEQLIKAYSTRHTSMTDNPDMAAQLQARQILGETLRLMKLSISEQARRYTELNQQREQINNHITITYHPH